MRHRDRRTIFICSVIVLMSAASAIGLFICQMSPVRNYDARMHDIAPTPAYQLSADNSRTIRNVENEFRLNVFLSATIHHNITINSPNSINIGVVDSVTNYTSSIGGNSGNNSNNRNWPNIDVLKREFYENLLNDSSNISSVTNENDIFPKIDELRMNPNELLGLSSTSLSLSNYSSIASRYGKNVSSLRSSLINDDFDTPDPCSHPEYMVFTWILCLIALATGLKLYYLVKTFMALIMVICYAILILMTDVFKSDEFMPMPLSAQMNILLVIFLTMVTYHARLVEVTSRLDFIWKEQAEKELANMKSNRYLNDVLIKVSKICFLQID